MAISLAAGKTKAITERYLTGTDSQIATSAAQLVASASSEPSYSLVMGGPGASTGAARPPPANKQFDKVKPKPKGVKQVGNGAGDRCKFFNQPGGCNSNATAGQICGTNPTKRHTCEVCGGGHAALDCPKKAYSKGNKGYDQGGGGGGGGGGKKRKKSR